METKQTKIESLLNQFDSLNTSSKYKVVNTGTVLDILQRKGFQVDQVSMTNARQHKGYQKHLVRLSNPDFTLNRTDIKPQILLYNSYNKSTALQFKIGLYRFVCANGLEAGNSYFNIKHKHQGSVYSFIDNALNQLDAQLKQLTQDLNSFDNIMLNQWQLDKFTNRVLNKTVFKDINKPNRIITDVNYAQRDADQGHDLFTVLNVLQERIIRGGIKYQTVKQDQGAFKIINNTTRAIKSIGKTQDYNTVIFDEALSIADDIKKAV